MRAHHEGTPRTCTNCGEPVVRLQAPDGFAGVSRWLHTPNRVPCLNRLTREETGTVAEPRMPVVAS